jgi:hypothetical protein
MLTATILLGLSVQGAFSAPPKQLLYFPNEKIIRVRPMFIAAADDNGGHRHTNNFGRKGRNETPAEIAGIVREMNKAYACAGIQLEFDPKTDFKVRNRTALNRNFSSDLDDPEFALPESTMTDRSKLPRKFDPAFTAEKLKLVEEFPDRIVFLLQDGSSWNWDGQRGRWFAGTQNMGLNANGMITASGVAAPLLIHEMGHYFGLPHTFANVSADSPARMKAMLEEAMKSGKSKDEAIRIFDGDGFADTPADPGPFVLQTMGYGAFKSKFGWNLEFEGPEGEPYTWKISPDVYNWMSYYPEVSYPHPATQKVEGHFSREQAEAMREFATKKLANKLVAKSNKAAHKATCR